MKNVGVLANPSDIAIVDQLFPMASTTSLDIGYGSKAVTVVSGLKLYAGKFYRLESQANPANWMEGRCSSYSGTTLNLNVDFISGSGTLADWLISDAQGHVIVKPSAGLSSTSVVLTDVPGLSFKALAGVNYKAELLGLFSSGVSTTGGTIKLNADQGFADLVGKLTAGVNANAIASNLEATLEATTGTTITATGTGTANNLVHIGFNACYKFSVDANLTIQFATEVDTSTATFSEKSRLFITRSP